MFTLNGPLEEGTTERGSSLSGWILSTFEELSWGAFNDSSQFAVEESWTDLKIDARISDKRLSISDRNFRDSSEKTPKGSIGIIRAISR